MSSDDYQTYKLGTFKLKSGEEIPDAFIAYKTLVDPSLPAIRWRLDDLQKLRKSLPIIERLTHDF